MSLLDVIFPKRCVNCGKIGKYFCNDCRLLIRPILQNEHICPMCGRLALDGITHPICRTSDGIDRLTSFFHYDGPARSAVKAIKYRLVSDLAKEFMNLVPEISTIYDQRSILIPIPLHRSRQKERGFNQAEVLGNFLGIPMRVDVLRRSIATPPQAELKRKERLKNMGHVFTSRHVSGSLVLFDDVFTTGATMRSAASALKRAGATHIWAVTMAR